MARFSGAKSRPSPTSEPVPEPMGHIDTAKPTVDAVTTQAVSPVALPDGDDMDRYERLVSEVRIRAGGSDVGATAVFAAARVRCLTPCRSHTTDREATRQIALFLASEATVTEVIDEKRALRRRNVDRYLMQRASNHNERSIRETKNVLYAAGRLLHPREYPGARVIPAPRFARKEAASLREIAAMENLVPQLPAKLAQRVQTILDLSYGAGARSTDFKILRGDAVSQVQQGGRLTTVVALPNQSGGVRLVPLLNDAAGDRIATLAKRAGREGMLLNPSSSEPERNLANRAAEQLRRLGHPTLSVTALRNRWVLDLAERIPAALLLQVADVLTAQVLADQRDQLMRYELTHMLALMNEARR